ncbi:type IV secretory system conjugative DNA transfer family protein [Kineosporia sp. R_H_3]|uniref:type IV secretory system conjugative DNA transfer family protein n=1 Tax=Kineosporia sp. R_H_3 TaxID=1961848 RepID=UPI000B4BDB41|nr:type IV secretory system conjugative DNA transfer family protein [Kineosporia sp. R_H_3]
MTTAIGPRAGLPREATTPFAVLALCWLPVGVVALIWVGGHTASLLTGHGWSGPDFGWDFARVLVSPGGVHNAWPRTPPVLVWICTGLLAATVIGPAAFLAARWVHHRPAADDPLPSLATARDVRAFTAPESEQRARRLRTSLADRPKGQLAGRDIGVPLGTLRQQRGGPVELRASWEDVLLAVMAPRAGKTTALAVPAILDAPGAVVATSNKADLWTTTSTLRAEETGEQVWVFDPQQIVYADRTWWWNPLRDVTTVEEAHRLAGHFVQEVRGDRGSRDFWSSAAHDLLTGLLLAAATSGRDLTEVYEWLNDPVLVTPVELLRATGHKAAAASLLGRMHGAPETRDGVYETARTAAQCLRDDATMAWVTPPALRGEQDLDEFDAAGFALTRQTLYLLSKDGAGAAAPLVAALTDRIMRQATRAAERRGGRLDPPLLVVLDEAANVCRIADLPELYSHFGSRGITPLTILQSYKQGVRVWGEHGMDALWSAATIKLIGAGMDDARLAEDLSRLVGDHDVAIRSQSYGDRRTNESVSIRRQRILAAEDIRALPSVTALLLATGCRPALLTLSPWFEAINAPAISAIAQDSKALLTRRSAGGAAATEDDS